MNRFGMGQNARRGWALVAAAVLVLAPNTARCDENGWFFEFVVQMAKPKKPTKPTKLTKPVLAACHAFHCPEGVCTGAALMPCCPICSEAARQESGCERCCHAGCAACTPAKPEHVCSTPLGTPVVADDEGRSVLEQEAVVLRDVCIDHERALLQMQLVVNQLTFEIQMLRLQMQTMQTMQPVQYFVPNAAYGPQPGGMPYAPPIPPMIAPRMQMVPSQQQIVPMSYQVMPTPATFPNPSSEWRNGWDGRW
jgi:hypothetical protein